MPTTQNDLIFDFWKDNKTDNNFKLSLDELVTKFKAWREFQINSNKLRGQSWFEYYYGSQLLICFIADPENILGLQSVYDQVQFNELYEFIREHLK